MGNAADHPVDFEPEYYTSSLLNFFNVHFSRCIRFRVSSEVVYLKSVWGFVKSMYVFAILLLLLEVNI